jgi:O-acetyl-ADP-ribose deacetylase (regulator of RNase III)
MHSLVMKEIKGNLLDAQVDIIAHCVNCQKTMGSGVAKSIHEKYPNTFQQYYKFFQTLGDVCITKEEPYYIANIFGQYNYGTEKRQLNYESLYTGLLKTAVFMKKENLTSIAFPDMIGCGRAGGARPIVLAMIKYVFQDFEIQLFKF